jgi:hypothetical protein
MRNYVLVSSFWEQALPVRPRRRVKAGAMMKINTWLSSLSFPLYGTGLACPPTAAGKGVTLEIGFKCYLGDEG